MIVSFNQNSASRQKIDFFHHKSPLLRLRLGLVENVGEMASAAVLTVKMSRHEDTGTTILVGTLTSQASDLAVLIDLVVLEDRKLNLLSLVLELLATSSQAEDEMESRLLLDVVVGQSAAILKL